MRDQNRRDLTKSKKQQPPSEDEVTKTTKKHSPELADDQLGRVTGGSRSSTTVKDAHDRYA
jgi:hypothetical protein